LIKIINIKKNNYPHTHTHTQNISHHPFLIKKIKNLSIQNKKIHTQTKHEIQIISHTYKSIKSAQNQQENAQKIIQSTIKKFRSEIDLAELLEMTWNKEK